MKLIIYELNEIPRRLIDYYIINFPKSTFSKIAKEGVIINTLTKDDGELHPWSTWPTVHRGVYNYKHNIRSINQDLYFSKSYKPIWEILYNRNIDIGLFGSLHSYPPLNGKNVKFYLPDTFAPKSDAYPETLKKFQDFNLKMSNKNKAIAGNISTMEIYLFLRLIFEGSISKNSAYSTVIHAIKEKIYPKYKTRRSTIQNVLSFDLYYKYLNEFKPSFSTYFTNHLAGMMHRYWKDLFPMDFNLDKKDIDQFHASSIIKSMHLADNNLKKLVKFSKKNEYNFWLISSMGQNAIERGDYIPELILRNLGIMLIKLDLNPDEYKCLPAMQPDYCIKSNNINALDKLRKTIISIKDHNKESIFKETYTSKGLNLNLSLLRKKIFKQKKYLFINNQKYSFQELGLELIYRDKGTAYHTPYGVLAAYGPLTPKLARYSNKTIETVQIAPSILNYFNIEIPSYMSGSLI